MRSYNWDNKRVIFCQQNPRKYYKQVTKKIVSIKDRNKCSKEEKLHIKAKYSKEQRLHIKEIKNSFSLLKICIQRNPLK